MAPQPAAGQDLILERILRVPRPLAFKAWTDPVHLAAWWGPKGFSNPECRMEPRLGGAIRILMRAPDGTEYPMDGVVREYDPPARLEFSCYAHLDASAQPLLETLTSVTFEEVPEGTRLTVTARVVRLLPGAEGAVAGMAQGWSESLDRLATHLGTGR